MNAAGNKMRNLTAGEIKRLSLWKAWSTLEDIQASLSGPIHMNHKDLNELSEIIRKFVIERARVVR